MVSHAEARAFADAHAGDITPYAWIITKDHLEGGPGDSDVGTAGPSRATEEQVELARTQGRPFKIYDDDGELYYEGRCWSADQDNGLGEEHFGPLQDFGTPNAGATEIKYKNDQGEWETL